MGSYITTCVNIWKAGNLLQFESTASNAYETTHDNQTL